VSATVRFIRARVKSQRSIVASRVEWLEQERRELQELEALLAEAEADAELVKVAAAQLTGGSNAKRGPS
jgi:hypothetical protein